MRKIKVRIKKTNSSTPNKPETKLCKTAEAIARTKNKIINLPLLFISQKTKDSQLARAG